MKHAPEGCGAPPATAAAGDLRTAKERRRGRAPKAPLVARQPQP